MDFLPDCASKGGECGTGEGGDMKNDRLTVVVRSQTQSNIGYVPELGENERKKTSVGSS